MAVGLLFLLLLLNRLLKPLGKAFSSQELAVIFLMAVIGAMISSRGLMEDLPSTLMGVNYYADEVNKWKHLFFPHIKRWLVPWDPFGPEKQEVVRGYFEGYHYGEPVPWRIWVGPLLRWYILVLLVFFSLFCLAIIMRKQWIENEKLPFPLVQLPLEMISERETFLTNKLMWLGFAIPAIVYTLNTLQKVFPYLPIIDLNINLKQYLTGHPWESIEYLYIYISFSAIGFFFLLPSQLLFSFWFFYFLFRAQEILAVYLGREPTMAPHAGAHLFVAYETAGGFFVLAGYLFYIAYPHLKKIFLNAIGRGREEDEVLPYRIAFWELSIAILLIGIWCKKAGMSLSIVFFEFLIYIFVEAIVMGRATSEGGMIMTEGCFTPLDIYSLFRSPSMLGAQNLTLLAFLDSFFTRDLRCILITAFLDGFKIGDSLRMRRRHLAVIFGIAVVFSIFIATILHLLIVYRKGGLNLYWFSFRGDNIRYFIENAPFAQGKVPSNASYLPSFLGGSPPHYLSYVYALKVLEECPYTKGRGFSSWD